MTAHEEVVWFFSPGENACVSKCHIHKIHEVPALFLDFDRLTLILF